MSRRTWRPAIECDYCHARWYGWTQVLRALVGRLRHGCPGRLP